MVHLEESEMELCRGNVALAIHCPQSNMVKIGSFLNFPHGKLKTWRAHCIGDRRSGQYQ